MSRQAFEPNSPDPYDVSRVNEPHQFEPVGPASSGQCLYCPAPLGAHDPAAPRRTATIPKRQD